MTRPLRSRQLQRLHQLGMRRDAGAAADQLDRRALEDVDLPADLAQERGGEQPRHRAADRDRAARGPAMHVHASPPGTMVAMIYQTNRVPSLRAKRSNLVQHMHAFADRDCFAEFTLGLAEGKTRGLAMTVN
jgi:hypothetical protein